MSHGRNARNRYMLTLRGDGGAELTLHARTVWASDSDENFQEAFPDVEFLDENDFEDLLEYLVDERIMTEREADDCTCAAEAIDTPPIAGPGEEDDDEDEETETDIIDVEPEHHIT